MPGASAQNNVAKTLAWGPVHIEAEPNAGNGFVQWEGDPAIAGSRDTDIADAALGTGTEVIARFAPCGAPYTIADGEADLAASTVGGPLVGWVEDDGRADPIVSESALLTRHPGPTVTRVAIGEDRPVLLFAFGYGYLATDGKTLEDILKMGNLTPVLKATTMKSCYRHGERNAPPAHLPGRFSRPTIGGSAGKCHIKPARLLSNEWGEGSEPIRATIPWLLERGSRRL